MTPRRWVAAAPIIAAAWTGSPAPAATLTAPITAVSWWSRQPAAAAQPAGGFQVAAGVDGVDSVAALRIEVPQGDGLRVALVLAEPPGAAPGRAAMRVCTTTDGWPAANPGPFTKAPKADCGHAVSLARAATTGRWTADVSSLVTPGRVADLMIEPVPQPVAGQVDPGFTVTVRTATTSAQGNVPPPAAGAPSPAAVVAPPGSVAPVDATTAPASAAPVPTAVPAAPPATAATAPSANPLPIASPVFSPQSLRHSKPWWRLALFVPLATAVGLGAAAVRRMGLRGLDRVT